MCNKKHPLTVNKIKLKGFISIPVAAGALLGITLIALGIGISTPSGEQSKLVYQGNLWCVSNFVQQEPLEILADGRPRQDKLLDGKEDWIVREQVTADSAELAEQKAQKDGHGLFEPSNKTELRAKLSAGDGTFFSSHFNSGATMAGPCWGTGSTTAANGHWLNDSINTTCGFDTSKSGYETVSGRPTEATITNYSPNMPGNTCDSATGGGASTADGGSFKVINGRIRYTKGGKVEDYVFAEPTTYNIIPKDKINQWAVVLDGFNGNKPIRVADTYAPNNHAGLNYLDLFLPCGSEYNTFQGGKRKITVVDLTKPKPPVTTTPNKTLPDGSACPTSALKSGPAEGEDYQGRLAQEFERQIALHALGQVADEFTGPLPTPSNNVAAAALKEVGYQGQACSNGKLDKTKYSGGTCVQWCAAFVTWVYQQAGDNIPSIQSAREVFSWFKSHGHPTFNDPAKAGEGDIVVWSRGPDTGHIGIVVANDPATKTMKVVEGNTSHDLVKLYNYPYEKVQNNLNGLIGFGRW
jgi:hypothetical protein